MIDLREIEEKILQSIEAMSDEEFLATFCPPIPEEIKIKVAAELAAMANKTLLKETLRAWEGHPITGFMTDEDTHRAKELEKELEKRLTEIKFI